MAVQPVYSVSEVARMLGKTRFSARRYLKRAGVEVDRTMPGKHHVWFGQLREAMPDLFDSLSAARSANRLEQLEMF